MGVENTGVNGVDEFAVGEGDGDPAVIAAGVELGISEEMVSCCGVETGNAQAWLVSVKEISNNMDGSLLFISIGYGEGKIALRGGLPYLSQNKLRAGPGSEFVLIR